MKDIISEAVAIIVIGLLGAIAVCKLGSDGATVAAAAVGAVGGYLTKSVITTNKPG